jgi:hypothetical protein
MRDIEHSGFSELDRLLELIRRTRELLDAVVDGGVLPDGGAAFIAERTLPHLEGVQAGFIGSLRAESAGVDELRFLLQQVAALRVDGPRTRAEREAADAEAALEHAFAELPGAGARPMPLPRAEPWHLVALAHARVVLAVIPRLPEEAVRFRVGRRSYADIPTPRGPAELAGRLEELEAQLWRTAIGRPAPPLDPAFRRTYGFFDAADRLGLRAFRGAA